MSDIGPLKAYSRQEMLRIWSSSQQGELLAGEDKAIADAMLEHPEYADIWAKLDRLTDEQIHRSGVNPILHVQMHAVVETQIANNNPPQVKKILGYYLHKRHDRHDAIHRFAGVLLDEMMDSLTDQVPFNMASYIRKLRTLV
jgi:hypothetical protein